MIDNVVAFKRYGQQEPYPDLWPRATYDSVLHALHRNQPVARVATDNYHFALKSDIPGPTCSVIIQGNNVLYQTPKSKNGDPNAFSRWFNKNNVPLKRLADGGFSGTIVGKMGHVDSVDYFCVYYIITKNDVYLDEPNLDRLLRKREDLFNNTVLAMPAMRLAVVTIDKIEGEVTATEMNGGLGFTGPIIGLPIVHFEQRLAESGTEAAPPRLLSTAVHMKYMAFQHTIGPSPRRIKIDEPA